MFYDGPQSEIHEELIYDVIKLDITQIVIGIESLLITLPLSLLTVFLFRHVTPNDAIVQVRIGDQTDADLYSSSKIKSDQENRIRINNANDYNSAMETESFRLPRWCIYFVWALTISTCLVSSYIVLMYGLTFGFNKSVAWLTSFIAAASNNVAIFQPLKVAVIVVIMTLWLKKPVGPVADITPRVDLGRIFDCIFNFLSWMQYTIGLSVYIMCQRACE